MYQDLKMIIICFEIISQSYKVRFIPSRYLGSLPVNNLNLLIIKPHFLMRLFLFLKDITVNDEMLMSCCSELF